STSSATRGPAARCPDPAARGGRPPKTPRPRSRRWTRPGPAGRGRRGTPRDRCRSARTGGRPRARPRRPTSRASIIRRPGSGRDVGILAAEPAQPREAEPAHADDRQREGRGLGRGLLGAAAAVVEDGPLLEAVAGIPLPGGRAELRVEVDE